MTRAPSFPYLPSLLRRPAPPWLAARPILAALGALLLAGTASAAPLPVTIASSAGAESTPIFVAAQEGIFARHGLDAKVLLVPLAPTLPAAIQSNSAQIGFMNAPTFIAAAAGGLDFVAISGGSVTSPATHNIKLMAGTQTDIHRPADLVGKQVGVPGFGAFIDITLRYWLQEQGVDWHKVHFVESTFASMKDRLRSGTLAAVGTMDPYAAGIAQSGVGRVIAPWVAQLPPGKPVALFVSRRDWATSHAATVAAFRAAYQESVAYIATHQKQARLDFGHYVHLPPAALLAMDTGHYQPHLTVADLDWWIGVMSQQDLLKTHPDAAKLIMQ